MNVERSVTDPNRAYVARDDRLPHGLVTLPFRTLIGLVSVEQGAARMRWRRRNDAYCCDYWLEPESDAHGVGVGTLLDLQRNGLVTTPTDAAPLKLTEVGRALLDELHAMDGVAVPRLAVAA